MVSILQLAWVLPIALLCEDIKQLTVQVLTVRQQGIYFRLYGCVALVPVAVRWGLQGFNDGDRLRPLDGGCVALCSLSFFLFNFQIYTLLDVFSNLCQLVGKKYSRTMQIK